MLISPLPTPADGVIHWEDMHPPAVFEFGDYLVTAEAIKSYAKKYDPQPFHLDEEAAKNTHAGALCASGWHVCAMMMRMLYDGYLSRSASMGAPGMDECRWRAPVFPGERLLARWHLLESRPLASRPNLGLIRHRTEIYAKGDADEEPVMKMFVTGSSFLYRRQAGARAQ